MRWHEIILESAEVAVDKNKNLLALLGQCAHLWRLKFDKDVINWAATLYTCDVLFVNPFR
jgi:hypothetical protein